MSYVPLGVKKIITKIALESVCSKIKTFDNIFHVDLMRGLQKCEKEISQWLFEIIHIIHFEMDIDRLNKPENISGI